MERVLKEKCLGLPARKTKTQPDLPTVDVSGRVVRKYNRLDAVEKAAKKAKESLRPLIMAPVLDYIFRTCCAVPDKPTTAVKAKDTAQAVVSVSFTSKYTKIEAKAVNAAFKGLTKKDGAHADPNDYVNCVVEGLWDSSVFVGDDGKFKASRAKKFLRAIRVACKEIGVRNPLTFSKNLVVSPTFSTERWKEFGPKEQAVICSCLPNVISVVAENDGVKLSMEKLD